MWGGTAKSTPAAENSPDAIVGSVNEITDEVAPPAGFEPATFRLEGGCSVH